MKSASIRSRMKNFWKIEKQMISGRQGNIIENYSPKHMQKKKSF